MDIDVIKEGGTIWSTLMDSISLPSIERSGTSQVRSALKAKFDATGKDMKKSGGIALLEPEDREALTNLFDKLAQYGLFIVPEGEVESWLKALGATGHGPDWVVKMFQLMGEDPDDRVPYPPYGR